MSQKLVNAPEIKLIIEVLEKYNGETRLVGGCVRDGIIGRKTTDVDLATTLVPQTVLTAFEKHGIKAIPTGLKHGTVTAVVSGAAYEVTTLRRDAKCDGRHASVVFTDNWMEDASRRDFTFNALYCDKKGKVYDYFSGIEDLQNRRVAFIGDAATRINEDFLRILRVFRFHASICSDKELEQEIVDVCGKYAENLSLLSKERIRSEFFKLLACPNCVKTLVTMQQCGVLAQIVPPKYHIDLAPLRSCYLALKSPITKLASMLKNEQSCLTSALVEHMTALLRLSKREQKLLGVLLSTDLKLPLSSAQQQKYMNELGVETYVDLLIISFTKNTSITESVLLQHLEQTAGFKPSRMPVTGKDLAEIGYKEGKLLGRTLKILQTAWENNPHGTTKAQLIALAKSMLN